MGGFGKRDGVGGLLAGLQSEVRSAVGVFPGVDWFVGVDFMDHVTVEIAEDSDRGLRIFVERSCGVTVRVGYNAHVTERAGMDWVRMASDCKARSSNALM